MAFKKYTEPIRSMFPLGSPSLRVDGSGGIQTNAALEKAAGICKGLRYDVLFDQEACRYGIHFHPAGLYTLGAATDARLSGLRQCLRDAGVCLPKGTYPLARNRGQEPEWVLDLSAFVRGDRPASSDAIEALPKPDGQTSTGILPPAGEPTPQAQPKHRHSASLEPSNGWAPPAREKPAPPSRPAALAEPPPCEALATIESLVVRPWKAHYSPDQALKGIELAALGDGDQVVASACGVTVQTARNMRIAFSWEIEQMKAAWPEQRPEILAALKRHYDRRVVLAEGKRG